MLLGLNTFEWIVIVLLILILIAIIFVISDLWSLDLIMRREVESDGDVTRNRLESLFADIKEAIKANSNAEIDIRLQQNSYVLAAIATHMKLGLATDTIKILDLDEGIRSKISNHCRSGVNTHISYLAVQFENGKLHEIPGIGEKEIKKIEKALVKYREDHVFH